jgi:hypothetical protein
MAPDSCWGVEAPEAPDPLEVRTFFRDVLGFSSVDAGGGWLIFALPPAELAAHPTGGEEHHELYVMCDDIHRTVANLEGKGFGSPVRSATRVSAC